MSNTSKALDLDAEVEKIRCESTNIHEVLVGLRSLWKSIGIYVTLNNYPANFKDKVSNSHNSPKGYKQNWRGVPEIVKGYPGWSGNWAGTINVDKEIWKKEITFRHLRDGKIINKKCRIPRVEWIKTCNGSSGSKFSIEGILFLYDFPKMKKEFENRGEDFKIIEYEYLDAIEEYYRRFQREKSDYIEQEQAVKKLQDYKTKLTKLTSIVIEKESEAKEYFASQFCKNYNKPLPIPKKLRPGNDEQIKGMVLGTVYDSAKVMPKLQNVTDRIEALSEELDAYFTERPEMFM